ncbi:MAG TPA: peptide ABC transporter substrate-binding protein [Anaerolineae bacterium]
MHSPNRIRLISPILIFVLSLSLACGLGLGRDGGDDTPPTIESESGSTSSSGRIGSNSSDDDGASTIDESTSGSDASESSDSSESEEAEPTTESSEESSITEADPTVESPTTAETQDEEPTGELAEDQIFILPGGIPPTMDPHLSGDATSAEYVVEIYSGLMAYDQDLNLIHDIAESHEVSDDGLVYTFTIREEAQFQDGKPIRAEDFKWSLERACEPATGSQTADTYLGDIVGCRDKLDGDADEVAGVQVIDDLTLELTIDEPKGFFPAKMTYPTAYVLDQENVESDPEWYNEPNSSGPFILETYAPDEGVIILARNDNFYRDPKPILERIVYVVGGSVNPMTGYEDDLSQLGLPDVSYHAIPIGTDDLSRATDPNNPLSEEFVATNALSVFYIGFNVAKPPFDDVNIRQALNLALDKRRMVRLVFQDTVPVANGIVPSTMPDYQNPDLSDYEYDPERALALVAESSYGDVSELPDITLSLSGSGGDVGPLTRAIIESYEANLGLEISVEQSPWPEFLRDLNNPNSPYQMYQLGWIADYPDPQNFLEVLFHSDSAQNHGHYSNPELDALLDKARGTQDTEERLALYRQAEQMILDDAAWIPLYFEVDNWLVKPYVHNLKIPPIKIPKFQYVSILEP